MPSPFTDTNGLRPLTPEEHDTARRSFACDGISPIWNALESEMANTIASALEAENTWTTTRAPVGHSMNFEFEQIVPANLKNFDPHASDIFKLAISLKKGSFVALAQRVSGIDVPLDFDFHPIRYRPGHFLELHTDEQRGAGRRLAYVLSLNRGWEFDWGGHLLFPHEDGCVSGFSPIFNRLVLFEVPKRHCVTPVSAEASMSRFTISGWFYET